jgi:putative ABC transport system permease protein
VISLLFRESIVFALRSLAANKLRSFLSLLGITIGIFAIILVFTIVDSLEQNIRSSIKSLGNNVVYVQKWPWIFGPYPWWKYINRPTPTYEEMLELQKSCNSVEALAFTVNARKTLKFGSYSIQNAVVEGISHDYYRIKSFELAAGRYFTRNETTAGYHFAVIGDRIAKGLFPSTDPVGREIRIGGLKATVIGVVKKEGESMFDNSMDSKVIIPYLFARYLMDTRTDQADPTIYAKSKANVPTAEMIAELTGAMRSIRKLKPKATETFALNEISLLTQGFDSIFDVLGTAGWVIGGFSILVGGFGIANIMFVSVRERTSLIGIQKSLGARNFFILVQFLGESVMLSTIGGAIGLLLTWIITAIGKSVMDLEITLSGANVVLGLTVSILIGIISGFVPAYGASQLDPVEAIRSNG